jgi:hypothetical protein
VSLSSLSAQPVSPDAKHSFYIDVLTSLIKAGIPFMVGGAYAFRHYTGIVRDTKDLDLFLLPKDQDRAMGLFKGRGYDLEFTAPHWLTKIRHDKEFVDFIFGLANGIGTVVESWFAHAPKSELMGVPVRLLPAEEMLWSKAFIMERDRFDGADINHLIRALRGSMDWDRLLRLFDVHWPIFLSHLILYRVVYPAERDAVPQAVWESLLARARAELNAPGSPAGVCYGTLLARNQYQKDVLDWDYADGRILPHGNLTPTQAAQ